MHPVSNRGRSMPRDRQTCSGFLAGDGDSLLVPVDGMPEVDDAAAGRRTGDTAGSGERTAYRSPASSPSGPGAPAVGGSGNSALAPAAPRRARRRQVRPRRHRRNFRPRRRLFRIRPRSRRLTPQPPPASPPVTAPADEAPADKPTPLLDAAIERVAAVTRQQRESLDSAPSPSEPDDHATDSGCAWLTRHRSDGPPMQPTPTPPLAGRHHRVEPFGRTHGDQTPMTHPLSRRLRSFRRMKHSRLPARTEPKAGVAVAEAESCRANARSHPGTLLDDTQPAAADVPAVADDSGSRSASASCASAVRSLASDHSSRWTSPGSKPANGSSFTAR